MSQYDLIPFHGKSLMHWAMEWFRMSNDTFYKLYGFNFNPHLYPGLYDEARKRVYGEEEQKMSEWISVKDRLPEEGVFVLVAREDGVVQLGVIESQRFCVGKCWKYGLMNITHWMPLPEPPRDAASPPDPDGYLYREG